MARGDVHMILSRTPKMYRAYADDGHTVVGEEPDTELTAYCGNTTREKYVRGWKHFTEDEARVRCTACHKKLAKLRLKARPADAPKVEAIKDEEARGGFRHKQGYKVLVAGDLVGYIGYEDHAWRVYPLMWERWNERSIADGPYARNTHTPMTPTGDTPRISHFSGVDGECLSYKTRDDAMIGCVEYREKGILKTPAELKQAAEDDERESKRRHAIRLRERAEAKVVQADCMAALHDILDNVTLSNFQRAGLATAIAKLGKPNAD